MLPVVKFNVIYSRFCGRGVKVRVLTPLPVKFVRMEAVSFKGRHASTGSRVSRAVLAAWRFARGYQVAMIVLRASNYAVYGTIAGADRPRNVAVQRRSDVRPAARIIGRLFVTNG